MSEGFTLWFTGLSGAGKSTLANLVADELRRRGHRVEILDGDEVRTNLSKGLGFSKEDRDTNIRRVGYVAGMVNQHGGTVICSVISAGSKWSRRSVKMRFSGSTRSCDGSTA